MSRPGIILTITFPVLINQIRAKMNQCYLLKIISVIITYSTWKFVSYNWRINNYAILRNQNHTFSITLMTDSLGIHTAFPCRILKKQFQLLACELIIKYELLLLDPKQEPLVLYWMEIANLNDLLIWGPSEPMIISR